MKKNVLLVNLHAQGVKNQLALWYLKAHLFKYLPKPSQIRVPILVFPVSDENKLDFVLAKIRAHNPAIIGFSCYVWNIELVLKISRAIKELMPKAKIVLGGPEVSPRAKELLKNNQAVDAVVRGEGEETFKELVEFFIHKMGRLQSIKGITYRNGDSIAENNPRPEIADLDTIPSPYLEGVADINFDLVAPLETSRGCSYKCHYCYYHKDFQAVRYFSLARVEKDLKLLLKKRVKRIYIMDPTFNLNKERAKQILRFIAAHNQQSRLHLELKAELLDEETVDLLYKAKVYYLEIGVQSTNRKTLKLINRNFDPQAFMKNIVLLNKKKIYYQIQLIDGLPGDNYESLKKSVDWLFGFQPPEIRIMWLLLLPGTNLRQNAGRFKIKYNPRPPYRCLESNTYSAKDLKKTERLNMAIFLLYGGPGQNKGLIRKSLFIMARALKITPTTVFEEWLSWAVKRYGVLEGYLDGGRLSRIDEAIIFPKISESIFGFIRHLCGKYGNPQAVKRISAQARYDRASFLKNEKQIL